MDPSTPTEDIYEERIARFAELAEAAQKAANVAAENGRANLQETYAVLASHWLILARMAADTLRLREKISRQFSDTSRTITH